MTDTAETADPTPPAQPQAPDAAPVMADPTPVETLPVSSVNVPGSPEVTPPKPSEPEGATLLRVPTSGDGWNFAPPDADLQQRIQKDLNQAGLYEGKQNGRWGPLSVAAISAVTKSTGRVSGEPSEELCRAVLAYSGTKSTDAGAILSSESWKAFASKLEETKNEGNAERD